MAVSARESEHEELRALNLVLRFLSGKRAVLGSVTSALYSLLISQKYNVLGLQKLCLQYLLQTVGGYQRIGTLNFIEIMISND